MDIKAKITEIVDKIKNDESLMNKFQSDPVKTVEGLIGVDLPDDQIKSIADGVKQSINISSVTDKLGGLFGKK